MQGYTIDEWCDKHRISRGTWYNLVRAGKAPSFIKVGSRTTISAEADAAWYREREASAAAEQEAFCAKRNVARHKAATRRRTAP